jgi:secreted trypsin-like serine protease
MRPARGWYQSQAHRPVSVPAERPSESHGSACGGDSGSPVFLGASNQLVAVHTGGYRLGPGGVICGRLTSLNHRLDTAVALDWVNCFL